TASALTILTEARTAAALNHPNVCTVFAVDDSEGVPVIAMEYVDGQPLSALLESGALTPAQAANLGRQIALGMAAAHSQGIVHGDLKPANLLVSQSGVVKITDFGLSRRAVLPDDMDRTREWMPADDSSIAGTPAYMAPEQTRGEPATPKSDVFSLGVMLYEMLTGKLAFTGANILQTFDQIRKVTPERYAEQVPERFTEILSRSLAREPQERAVTMDWIAERLR
ncbi:MAG TPA: serine/threonine-protein kinase, partial [Terriglobales bacterium]|nr:serine/threonine-protein kinase [Terriglobales bacterium]